MSATRRDFLKQVAAACALTALPGAGYALADRAQLLAPEPVFLWKTLDAYRGHARIERLTETGIGFRWDIPAVELLAEEGVTMDVMEPVGVAPDTPLLIGVPLLSVAEPHGPGAVLKPVGYIERAEIDGLAVRLPPMLNAENRLPGIQSRATHNVFGTMEIYVEA